MSWYVFHTKPRNEKKVAQRLTDKGFDVYLPLQKMLRQWSDRKKKVEEPLYKSYVFFQGSEVERQEAIQTPGIVRCLFHNRKPALVRDEEIEAIRAFLGELENYPEATINQFEIGDSISIKSGALKGLEGKYVDRHGDDLFLLVETMGRIVHAKLPARYVVN